MILFADVILNVVDAVHLERDLFLTQQILDMGIPVVVALNMMDEVKRNGLQIDVKTLSEELGVEVIPTTATKNQGIDAIKEALKRARPGKRIPEIDFLIKRIRNKIPLESEALLALEEDENILKRHMIQNEYRKRDYIYQIRRKRVDFIVDKVVSATNEGASFKTKLGRWMLNRLQGFLFCL